jgi:hypothetical protein
MARASAFQAEGCGFESRFPLHCKGEAHVAQSVEHFLGKEEVTGSIPVVGSISPPGGLVGRQPPVRGCPQTTKNLLRS